MRILKNLMMLTICGGLIFASCTKEAPEINVEEIQDYEVQDEIAAETFAEDIENAIDDELEYVDIFFDGGIKHGDEKGPNGIDVNANCATREASAARGVFPNTVTITMSEGCQGRHGQSIQGTIAVTLSANPRTEGATKTVTLTDFRIGEVTVNGTRTLTNMGRTTTDNPRVHRTEEITITRGDVSLTRNSDITTTFMAGDDTDSRDDDSIERTGTVTAMNSRGETYTTRITTALTRKGDCRWPVSGIREIKRGEKTITLDYGDGTCDNEVTATLGDRSKVFEIQ